MARVDTNFLFQQGDYNNWLTPGVGAKVPAVELTHEQWRDMKDIIQALGDLVDDCSPNEVENSLIQGRLLKNACQKASGLKHKFGL
jgi:hypothetical protein